MNSMQAYFSGTDNGDEKVTKIYGVFGKLNTDQHEEKFRVIVNGNEIALNYDHIFDFKKEELDNCSVEINNEVITVSENKIKKIDAYKTEIPTDWYKNVTGARALTVDASEARYFGRPIKNQYSNYIGVDFDNYETELELARAKRDRSRNLGPIGMDECPLSDMEKRELDEENAGMEIMDAAHEHAEEIIQLTANFADPDTTHIILSVFDDYGALKSLGRAIDRYMPR